MLKRGLATIVIFFAIKVSIAQNNVSSNDPYVNRVYLGLNFGPDTKSFTTSGVDAQVYFLKAKIAFNGRYYNRGLLGREFFKVYGSVNPRPVDNIGIPEKGVKNGYDFEMGANYNFKRVLIKKTRRIFKAPGERVRLNGYSPASHENLEVSNIRMLGLRLGIGQFRSIIKAYSAPNNYNLSSFDKYFDMVYKHSGQSYTGLFLTNVHSTYLYFGGQYTGIINYYLKGGFPPRRSTKVDYYFDCLVLLNSHMSDIKDDQTGAICKIIQSKKSTTKVGGRLGFHKRAARYFLPSFGGEFGFMPGYRFSSDGYILDKIDEFSMFGKVILTLSLTHPNKTVRL
jgi:hypothetical protein